jgi:hypothetical protein
VSLPRYLAAHEVQPGDLIYLAHSSTTPSRVTEVREPSHALAAAYGATVFEVETYISEWRRFHPQPPFTAWPDRTFRLETEPSIWLARPAEGAPDGPP